MMLRQLSPRVFASGQIQPGELALAREEGVTLVVNNRPDRESPDQPDGRVIAEQARALGMDYAAIPVDHTGFSLDQVQTLARLLDRADGKTLLYCRSGTRSTLLWALAQASAGEPVTDIAAAAERAGYSVEPVRSAMEALSSQSGDSNG